MNVILLWGFKNHFFFPFPILEKKKKKRCFGLRCKQISFSLCLVRPVYPPFSYSKVFLEVQKVFIVALLIIPSSLMYQYIFSPTCNYFFLIFSLELCQQSMGIFRPSVAINKGNVFSSEVQLPSQ